jgi:hypothetical protein
MRLVPTANPALRVETGNRTGIPPETLLCRFVTGRLYEVECKAT